MTLPEVQLFLFKDHSMAYRKFGHGPAALLAFHGFGQTGQVYLSIEKHLGDQFTVFAIDLFFHGDSRYVGNQLLTKNDWYQLIEAFLCGQHIKRFSLMGFSLGGRFALTTAENFSDRIDQLILIAPDGITRNFWYELATGSDAGRRLFRYILRHLSILNGFGHALTQLGLLNRTVMRFVEISLSTHKQREQVYQSWTQFRRIQPNLERVSEALNSNEISIWFFTGAFDRLVPGAYIVPLTERLRCYDLTVLKTGHNRLIELATGQFVQRLNNR